MNFRFKLKSGVKGSDIVSTIAWIASGKEADAREWAKVQMKAWGWEDGKILECAVEYMAPVATQKKPYKLDERGLPIMELTDGEIQKLVAMSKSTPDIDCPGDDDL
jgi:hypothetical protein